MKYVIDLDRLSNGIDYWRNPDYQPQKFGAKNGFFKMVEAANNDSECLCAYSSEAEKNMPEIVQWFEKNGINIPIIFKKDDDMVEIWNDKAIQVDPDTGEFVITQQIEDNQLKKTTYAPVQIEVTSMNCQQEAFADVSEVQNEKAFYAAFRKLNINRLKDWLKDAKKNERIYPDRAGYSAQIGVLQPMVAKLQKIENNIADTRDRAKRIAAGIRASLYPPEKSKDLEDKLNKIIEKDMSKYKGIPESVLKQTEKDKLDLNEFDRRFSRVIKLFARNKAAAEGQRNRLNKILEDVSDLRDVPGLKQLRKEITTAIGEIDKSKEKDYSDVVDKLGKWASIQSPISKSATSKEVEKVLEKKSLEERVAEFRNLSKDRQLVQIVSKQIEPDVFKAINAGQLAFDIIDTMIKRPYQRDFFKRVKNAEELQLAKDAVEKIDGVINNAGIDRAVGDKLHAVFFNQYIKGGEELANQVAKQVGEIPNLGEVVEAAIVQSKAIEAQTPEAKQAKALSAIDRQISKIEDLVVEINKFATTIDEATPQQIDKANAAIGNKRANYKLLKDTIARLEGIPGQSETNFFQQLKSRADRIEKVGFTTLETAILAKAKRERELELAKKLGTAEKIGEAIGKEADIEKILQEGGTLTKDQKIELTQSEYQLPISAATNIAAVYSADQIRAGKPFADNPRLLGLSSMPKDKLVIKLKSRGVKIADGDREQRVQQLTTQVNASTLTSEEKQRLTQVIQSDKSQDLAMAIAEIQKAIGS
jgi:ribonuclease HII